MAGILGGTLGASAADRPGLRWPLDPRHGLRSIFGEYREGGRVHGGVDLSTGGVNGLTVRAAGDGEVFRLKVEWRGYGRALYQRLDDGRILVYAHLERFTLSGLEEAVSRARARSGRFPGDIAIEPPLRVRRGDALARSGESGAGLPHLHFEVRSADNRPLDPLRQGFPRIADTRAPVYEAVWLHAAAPGAWVGGPSWSRRLPVRRGKAGVWEAGPVKVSGPVQIAFEAYDPSPEGGRMGVAGLEVRADGRVLWSHRPVSFDFGSVRAVAAVHDASISHLSPTRFAFRPPAVVEPPADGSPSQSRRVELEAFDAVGNRARLRLRIDFVPQRALAAESALSPPPAGDLLARFDPAGAHWLPGALFLKTAPDGTAPAGIWRLVSEGARGASASAWGEARGSAPELWWVPLPEQARLRFESDDQRLSLRAAQRATDGGAVSVEVGDARLWLPAGAYPAGGAVSIQELSGPPPDPGLEAAGPALRLEPGWRIPAASAVLRLRFDARAHQAERLGLYRWDAPKERWSYAGGVGQAGSGALEIEIGELGIFRLLEDVAPPEPAGESRPVAGLTMPASGWSVRVGVADSGCGIAWDGVRVELDGRLLESEYDPDRKWAEAELAERLTPGEHRLRVEARDRAGNVAPVRDHTFQVSH
jgi:hypothetical protein